MKRNLMKFLKIGIYTLTLEKEGSHNYIITEDSKKQGLIHVDLKHVETNDGIQTSYITYGVSIEIVEGPIKIPIDELEKIILATIY